MVKELLTWIRKRFRKSRIRELPLSFEMELDENCRHVVKIYGNYDGRQEKVEDVEKLWDYGSIIEKEGVRYSPTKDGVETLLSLRSLNPTIGKTGELEFEMNPSIHVFLRDCNAVKEGRNSKEMKYERIPLEVSAKVDFISGTGLKVITGYRRGEGDDVIEKKDLRLTSDGGYARFGNTFIPLPRNITPEQNMWLEKSHFTVSEDHIPEFIKRDLLLLKSNLTAVITPSCESIEILEGGYQPSVRISADEPGWLDFKVEYKIGNYTLPHDLFARNDFGYIHLDKKTWIAIDTKTIQKTRQRISELGAIETIDGLRVPISKFASVEEFIRHIGGLREAAVEYDQFVSQLTDFKTDEEFTLDQSLERNLKSAGIQLRPYQRAGIQWLSWLGRHHLHAVLADDMGLGKTIQAIVAIHLLKENSTTIGHSLIICPKSVVHFWKREILRCFPDVNVIEHVGVKRNLNLFKRKEPAYFITTYETLAKDISIVGRIPFFIVVLDEATKIKNPDTKRSRAIKSLNAKNRIALSGTPIENRTAELWSLFDFLMKGHLGTRKSFITRYENPILYGDSGAASELAKRVRPFILRRLKKDVAQELPEKIDIDEWCELTEEQKSLYGQIQDQHAVSVRKRLIEGENVNYTTSILPVIIKLKQVCDHPALITGENHPLQGRSEKFDWVLEKVDEIISQNDQVVIFSHFLYTLDLLEIKIGGDRIPFIRIDGSVQNRQKLIDTLNEGRAKVALCSIQACGYGINLTNANHVIHIDRWWNPAV